MNYWLVKSEPDDFSIDDLAGVDQEPWTGVRNYQARNFMRDKMETGDLVLYYHSNTKVPGVVGLAKVASRPYADPTQFDGDSKYFDEKSTEEKPRWILVDLAFEKKFSQLVALTEMKAMPELEGMKLLTRGNRLSVMPVEKSHFDHIVALAE